MPMVPEQKCQLLIELENQQFRGEQEYAKKHSFLNYRSVKRKLGRRNMQK